MTKLSLLGTASALALTLALTQGASAFSPGPYVDDNQVNALSDGNANDSSTINKTFTANTDNSITASTDDDKTANDSFNYSNREEKRDRQLQLLQPRGQRADRQPPQGRQRRARPSLRPRRATTALPRSMAMPSTTASVAAIPALLPAKDVNTGSQTDVSLGDVMVNLASANAGLHGASMQRGVESRRRHRRDQQRQPELHARRRPGQQQHRHRFPGEQHRPERDRQVGHSRTDRWASPTGSG